MAETDIELINTRIEALTDTAKKLHQLIGDLQASVATHCEIIKSIATEAQQTEINATYAEKWWKNRDRMLPAFDEARLMGQPKPTFAKKTCQPE